MQQAEEFLRLYQQTSSLIERRQIAERYKVFYAQLNSDDQKQADKVMQALWPGIRQKIDDLDSLIVKAEALLANEPAYEKQSVK